MKRKIFWLLVSCLMVLSLVLASCAPAVTEKKEEAVVPAVEEAAVVEEEEVVEEGPEMVRDSLGRMVEKPRYGGQFVGVEISSPLFFDEAVNHIYGAPTQMYTNEHLLHGNWAAGPTGTGEASFLENLFPIGDALTGCIAEGWEIVDSETFIFYIRKGVHFHNKPPTNGREVTADDVVFSLKRLWETPTHYYYASFPWDSWIESITAPDKWTVVVKAKPGKGGPIYVYAANQSMVVPPEVVEKYGDLRDWKNACGTGPFMLTEYVSGSSMLLEKNPNYWGKDPLHPENQLPYVDSVKLLIIGDLSTRLAALRTGKIDRLAGIEWQEAENLLASGLEVKHLRVARAGTVEAIFPRLDKGLPWDDIRVRRALAMAVDNQAIVDEYYGGNAEVLAWPVPPIPEYSACYIPLDELPESSRELYEYHPDKARQLLTEAGYPDGFKCQVVCWQMYVDLLTLYRAYWADIGVDLELDVREYGAYSSACSQHTYPEMCIFYTLPTICYKFTRTVPGGTSNYAMIDDPLINEAQAAVSAVYLDTDKRSQEMKKIVPHMIEQSYLFQTPMYYTYTMWHPWVKSYSGERTLGTYEYGGIFAYVWIDQALKAGGKP